MDKFIPTEVKDLTESKERVIRNVVNKIENPNPKPKRTWQYAIITVVVTMCVMLFILNEVLTKIEPSVADQPSPTELHIDLLKPIFSEEQGLYYLDGVTLGDSQSKVIERLGENYTIEQEDEIDADFIMDYDGMARFYFNENQLDSIVYMNVDKNYYDKLFNGYDGFKYVHSRYVDHDNHYFYSKESSHVLHASRGATDGNLNLSLYYPDSNLKGNAEFLYMTEQNINNEQQYPIDLNIDLAKPTFSEEQGYFYFHGVTLGDSPSKVIERLGGNYIIGQADGSDSDFLLNYDGLASFLFYNDKLDSIVLMKVDKDYFAQIYENYEGIKYSSDGNRYRYIFSQETYQLIKGEIIPDGSLYVYLMVPDDNLDFFENMGYQETEQSSTPIEEKKPEFKEVEGLFYLHGVTLGEPQSDVIERLGENYAIMDEEEMMSSPDYVFEEDGKVRLYIRNDKLFSVAIDNVNQEYFNQLFESYEGIKFGSGQHRFIYSKETDHIIKAEIIPDGSLTLSLFYPGPDFKEIKDSLDLINE
ncbi:hypothetical protein MHZ92_18395 [Sporosarcina sp. ACRSL]|uniref:hypothetical protein n=1 Tax=Sporosarcina sp. ACRSL TaxID=2918215 RepID=UPI001EF4C69C|nr:hypothetical protein [Sporosarcina sp. ACRSL]MCG7346086.1 hypothetical protein [Sporosarcina sp. ACRSL]